MDNTTITDKVLARIHDATPHSRAYFTMKNVLMWLLALVSIVVGALAVGSIIFRTVNAGVALAPGALPLRPLMRVIPVLWVVLTSAFGYLAYREVRATRKGYKYELSTIVLAMLLTSTVLGIIFYSTGMGFRLDTLAGEYVPFHASLERIQEESWLQPMRGMLVGRIRADGDEGEGVQVIDPARVVWQVTFAERVSDDRIAALQEGERVGMRGAVIDPVAHTFLACEVRSLEFAGRGDLERMPMHSMHMGERKVSALRTTECEEVSPRD